MMYKVDELLLLENLLAKTGYKNRVQLAVKARIEGLVISEE